MAILHRFAQFNASNCIVFHYVTNQRNSKLPKSTKRCKLYKEFYSSWDFCVVIDSNQRYKRERIKFYDMTAWDMTLWSLHLSVAPFTCMAIHARIPRVWNCISCLKSWIVVECWNFRSSSNPDCNSYLYINNYNINHLHTHLPFPRHITATVNTSKNIHLWAIASFTTFLTIRCCQSFNNQPKSELL